MRRRPICDYLITLLRRGRAELDLAGVTVPVPAGVAFLIPPGEPWTARFLTPVELTFVHCSPLHDAGWRRFPHRNRFELDDGDRARFRQPSPEALWGMRPTALCPPRLRKRVARELPRLVDRWLAGGSHHDTFLAEQALAALLAAWIEAAREDGGGPGDLPAAERLSRAVRMAERHRGIDLAVMDLARAAGWGRVHFSEAFTAARGEGPGAFLRRLRLEEARSRLEMHPWPIAELGRSVGYPDGPSFARAFRRAFGCTPGAWRTRQTAPSRTTTSQRRTNRKAP